MNRYLFGLIGLAMLCGGPLFGQAPPAVPSGPAVCNATACGPAACAAATCGCETGCNACDNCCPNCGCRLVPVCHVYCDTKKVTEHKYTCICEEVCIPGCSCCCKRCGNGDGSGSCGDTCNNGCQEGCGGRCRVREVPRLVIHPVTKEVPVRKCTVEWVCPKCGACGQCGSTAAPLCQPNVN